MNSRKSIAAIRDHRIRHYLAPQRIMLEDHVQNSETLFAGEFQSCVCPGQPLCRIAPGGRLLLDFGTEIAGGLRIVTAPNNGRITEVKITFGESASEALGAPDNDHALHQTLLELAPTAMTEYGNTGFRFVLLEVPGDAAEILDLRGVCAVSLMHDYEKKGGFCCSDPRLNEIWEVGAHTVQLCMQDYIYDGIKRDRMVWTGDLYPEIRTILQVFGAVDIIDRSLEFVLKNTAREVWMNNISSYSAWFILCVYELYRQTGDVEILRKYHAVSAEIAGRLIGCIGRDGHEKLDGFRFLDWPTSDDEYSLHAGLQGLLSWSLQCLFDMAKVLNVSAQYGIYETALRRLRSVQFDKPISKSAAAMLVRGRILTLEQAEKNVFRKNPTQGISAFFGSFILEERVNAGNILPVLELIRKYWGGMLDCGATTFWEDFDLSWLENAGRIDEIPQPGQIDIHREKGDFCYKGLRHSLCHGWSGGVSALLSEKISGVRLVEPGYKAVEISPQFGNLSFIEIYLPTPFGEIKVEGKPDSWSATVPKEINCKLIK